MRHILPATLFLAAFCMLGPVDAAWAVGSVDSQAQMIFETTMSPFCPGRLLEDCPSPEAAQLRDKIRAELISGESPDHITQELYSTYGTTVRAAPEDKGFGMFAWWTPVAFVALGAFVLAFWLSRKRSAPAQTAEKSQLLSTDVQARIDRELEKF